MLDRQRTTFVGDLPDATWDADYFSRLTSGWHSWEQSNDPWHPAEDGTGGEWTEAPWAGNPHVQSLRNAHSVDLGACSIFIPWKWEDRDPRLDPMIGPMLGDRGLAELTLDELDAARAESSNTTETQDVAWFFDAFTNLWPRDNPSEFHYHVSTTGKRQACLRSYFATNTKLGVSEGAPTFTLDESSIVVEMEPYPRLKPACNNNFVPLVKEGLADGVRTLADSVITEQLATLTADLPFEIRRIELTPSGAYLVVAQSYNDGQYAAMKLLGMALDADPGLLCRPELGDSDFTHVERSQADFGVPKRGITR